jgi:beta-glucosidase
MPLPNHWAPEKIKTALGNAELSQAQIDQALERRYTQAFKAGIFDRKLEHSTIDFAAGGQKAREIGGRGSVLLQNNGALPLAPNVKSVVLMGKASQVYAQQAVAGGAVVGEPMGAGGGSSDVVPNYTVSPIEGLRSAVGNSTAVKLILVDDANSTATIDGKSVSFADALAEAAKADAVVMMAGTIAEEGADRATFTDTSGHQLAAPASVGSTLDWYASRSNNIATQGDKNSARNSQTMAMLQAVLNVRSTRGKPMAAKSVLVLKDNAGPALPAFLVGKHGPAIVETWFPGQEDGNIVADILFGRVNPSGRLPVTMPLLGKGFLDHVTGGQFPGALAGDGKTQTVTYSEKLHIGYRWYDANVSGACAEKNGRNPCVAFPFGHGLSYTSFALGKPSITADAQSGTWRVTTPVRNTGKRAGTEVVQVYVSLPASANAVGAVQAPKRLVAFKKIALEPGAAGDVTITLDPKANNHPLSVWDEQAHQWVMPAGRYTIWAGRSSAPADLARAGVIDR